MAAGNSRQRPQGAVSGLGGRKQPVVRDVEALDATPLPDDPANVPRPLIDLDLLTDEIDDDQDRVPRRMAPMRPAPATPSSPQGRPVPPPPEEPTAPAPPPAAFVPPPAGASESARRRRPQPEQAPEQPGPAPSPHASGPAPSRAPSAAPPADEQREAATEQPTRRFAPPAETVPPAAFAPPQADPLTDDPAGDLPAAPRFAPPGRPPAAAGYDPAAEGDLFFGEAELEEEPEMAPEGRAHDAQTEPLDERAVFGDERDWADEQPGPSQVHREPAGDDEWASPEYDEARDASAVDHGPPVIGTNPLPGESGQPGLPPRRSISDYVSRLEVEGDEEDDDYDSGPPSLFNPSSAPEADAPSKGSRSGRSRRERKRAAADQDASARAAADTDAEEVESGFLAAADPMGEHHEIPEPPRPAGKKRGRLSGLASRIPSRSGGPAEGAPDPNSADFWSEAPSMEEIQAMAAAAGAGADGSGAGLPAGPGGPGAAAMPEVPKIMATAVRGYFAGNSALSLISPNLSPHEDELDDALSAFSLLEPNMMGFIRVDFRSYPEFKGLSAGYVQALRTGQNPEPQRNIGGMVIGSLVWVVKTFIYHANGQAQRGVPPPRAPWQRAPVTILSSKDMSDDTKQAIRDAERKSQAPSHYETMLSIAVVGPASEKDSMESVRFQVQAGFDVYGTSHQRLVWQERPGLDALIGYMPPDQERRLVLAGDELAELARIPDMLTKPQGVIVHRARIKPLPPTNPVIVGNPIDPDGGKIPLGLINRGTDDEKVVGMRNSELDQHMLIAGRTGTGKSLSTQTPVPTPAGWTTMGALKEGDEVFDETGKICRVTDAWAIRHDRPCYEVVFNDGTTIIADGEHQWLTETWAARKSRSEATGRASRPTGKTPAEWVARVEELDLDGEPLTNQELVALGVPKHYVEQMKYAGKITPCGRRRVSLDQFYGEKKVVKTREVDCFERRPLIAAVLERAGGTGRDQSHKRARASVVTTEDIRATLTATYDGRPNHSIDLAGAAQYLEADLPIGPYTLGAFLGDGGSRCSTIASMDPEVRQNIEAEGHETSDRQPSGGGCPQYGILGIRPALRALSLDTTGSKHIPDLYKTASVEQRWALLQGLMDTDGSADKRGILEYYSTKKRLAEDVLELVASLGLLGRIRSKRAMLNGKDYGESYTVSFTSPRCVFRIPRKAVRQSTKGRITNRMIVDVRPVPSVPVRCIAVDSPSHLFLVGRSYVPTHNSVALQWLIHGAIKADYPVVVVDPHGALCDDIARNIISFAPERVKDLVIVDFGHEMFPVALNPLDIHHQDEIEPTVSSVKEMLARQMSLSGDSAPRAVNYATQALTVLAEANLHLKDPETKTTLLQVPRFFEDTEFRQLLMNFCSNPTVRDAFDPERGLFEQLSPKGQGEIAAPIMRAFQPLGNSRSFANVFSAGENRLDFAKLVMDNKIILLKLSHFGGQGDLATFVGSLVIPYLLQSMNSWGRVKDPDTGKFKGRGLRLFIDEAPTVCGPGSSAVTVLAQARKWDLGLVAACQFPKQFDRSVEEEFYANTATKICLALDPQGVGGMARSLAGDSNLITQNDIVGLPNYAAYENVLLSGDDGSKYTSGVFAVQTLPPMEVVAGKKDAWGAEGKATLEKVREQSRALICNHRDVVEAKRPRAIEDIRSALTQVLSDRAGDIPGLQEDDGDDRITALDLDGDDDDWLSGLN